MHTTLTLFFVWHTQFSAFHFRSNVLKNTTGVGSRPRLESLEMVNNSNGGLLETCSMATTGRIILPHGVHLLHAHAKTLGVMRMLRSLVFNHRMIRSLALVGGQLWNHLFGNDKFGGQQEAVPKEHDVNRGHVALDFFLFAGVYTLGGRAMVIASSKFR